MTNKYKENIYSPWASKVNHRWKKVSTFSKHEPRRKWCRCSKPQEPLTTTHDKQWVSLCPQHLPLCEQTEIRFFKNSHFFMIFDDFEEKNTFFTQNYNTSSLGTEIETTYSLICPVVWHSPPHVVHCLVHKANIRKCLGFLCGTIETKRRCFCVSLYSTLPLFCLCFFWCFFETIVRGTYFCHRHLMYRRERHQNLRTWSVTSSYSTLLVLPVCKFQQLP